MKINLHIERLILNGLPLETRHGGAVKTAIETELARLITEGAAGRNWQGGAVASIRAGGIQLTSQGSPGQLGKEIAGSIYGSIGGDK